MTSEPAGIRSDGPGGAQRAGGGAPLSLRPVDVVEGWINQAGAVQLLLQNGHTTTALHELNDLLRQMTVLHEAEAKPPENVQRALAALRVIVRDLPAWKGAAVSLFLAGIKPHDLRMLSMSQTRTVVWDLAATLNTLHSGGRA